MTDFASLRAHLERHGALPPAWTTVREPDRELRRLWDACEEPWVLLELAERVVGRAPVVLAASACVRVALASVPDADPALAGALDVVEGWARGEQTDARVDDAQERIGALIEQQERNAATADAPGAHGLEKQPENVAYACFYVAQIARSGCWPRRDDPDACRALSHAAECLGEGGMALLADRARASLRCPTLDQLLAAYRHG